MNKDYFILNTNKLRTRSNAILNTIQITNTLLNSDLNNEITKMNNLAIGNYSDIKFPVIFYNINKHKYNEIIATGTTPLLIVSEKFKNLVEKNNLTGCSFFNITIKDKLLPIKKYFGFSVTGKSDQADWSVSQIIEKSNGISFPSYKCRKGFFLKNNKYPTTDFSFSKKSYWILLTNTAFDVISEMKLKCIELIKQEEFEIDESLIQK